MGKLVSIPTAADYLGCSTKTIRRRIADGSLPAWRMGSRFIRVDLDDVRGLLIPSTDPGAAE